MIQITEFYEPRGCLSCDWCPSCQQVITNSLCMCALVCDKHGQVCNLDFPDGDLIVRSYNEEPNGYMHRYKNK